MFIKPFYFFQFLFIFFVFNFLTNYLFSFIVEDSILTETNLIVFWFLLIFYLKYNFYEDIDYNIESLGENNNDGLNYDLFFKFIQISVEQLWFFNSLIFTEIKKWHLFTFKFKYFYFFKTNSAYFDLITKKLLLIWRPIFKKWSYLGYYRANRSKWIK